MKLLTSCLLVTSTSAFQAPLPTKHHGRRGTFLQADIPFDVEPSDVSTSGSTAREDLLTTAQSLNDKYGLLIIDKNSKTTLNDAAKTLENETVPANTDVNMLIGEWDLVCSTAMLASDKQKSFGINVDDLPLINASPIADLRRNIKKSLDLQVQQVIKKTSDDDGVAIDRVDHVLQSTPLNLFRDVVVRNDDVPQQLRDSLSNVDLNPLKVGTTKAVLVHKAEVKSSDPQLDVQLNLQSVVLNVAGKSEQLDPNGADVLGLNIPLSEFLDGGSFKTTYMDETLRISRSKTGIVEQLRVFTRAPKEEESVDEVIEDEADAELIPLDDDDEVDVAAVEKGIATETAIPIDAVVEDKETTNETETESDEETDDDEGNRDK
uniref:Plastid lipid-associated protein/fibrillin conserved domain-containing protein n=1 Tax=Craspedostauros australis TaxID=1486917 RepID=A0A7R9WRH3_9STRA